MPSVLFLLKNARETADFPLFLISLLRHIVVIGFVGRHTGKRLALFRNIGEIATLIKLQLAFNGIDENAFLVVELYTSIYIGQERGRSWILIQYARGSS